MSVIVLVSQTCRSYAWSHRHVDYPPSLTDMSITFLVSQTCYHLPGLIQMSIIFLVLYTLFCRLPGLTDMIINRLFRFTGMFINIMIIFPVPPPPRPCPLPHTQRSSSWSHTHVDRLAGLEVMQEERECRKGVREFVHGF